MSDKVRGELRRIGGNWVRVGVPETTKMLKGMTYFTPAVETSAGYHTLTWCDSERELEMLKKRQVYLDKNDVISFTENLY